MTILSHRCTATKESGRPCLNPRMHGEKVCWAHATPEQRERLGKSDRCRRCGCPAPLGGDDAS